MKTTILIAIFAGLLSSGVYADYDPVLEAREAAERKAEQQQAARKKAEHDKMFREASAKAYRKELGKEAVGKSDAEVERIYKKREADILKQAAAASGKPMSSQLQRPDPRSGSQHDAQMKAMTGKSIIEVQKMSDKEFETFANQMEKKYGK